MAWLTKSASILYDERPTWFLVQDVQPSSVPGWVYLVGYEPDDVKRAQRHVFVRVEGLVVRRGC